jgi:hypothetical protein
VSKTVTILVVTPELWVHMPDLQGPGLGALAPPRGNQVGPAAPPEPVLKGILQAVYRNWIKVPVVPVQFKDAVATDLSAKQINSLICMIDIAVRRPSNWKLPRK